MRLVSALLVAMAAVGPAAVGHAEPSAAQEQPPPGPDAQPPPAPDDEGAPAADAGQERNEAPADRAQDPEAADTGGPNADPAESPDRPGDPAQARTASADSLENDDSIPREARGIVDWMLGTYCPGIIGSVDVPRTIMIDQIYGADHSFRVIYGPIVAGRLPPITGGRWEYVSYSYDGYGWHVDVDVRTDQYPPTRINFLMQHSNAAISATDFFSRDPRFRQRRMVKCN
jgi:hypothetical protein